MAETIINATMLNDTSVVCKFLHPLELPWWLVIVLGLVFLTLLSIDSVLGKAKEELVKINAQLKIIAKLAEKHNVEWDTAAEANSRRRPLQGNVVAGRMGYWPNDG